MNIKTCTIFLSIALFSASLNSESWDFAPSSIPPGKYEGPMQEYDTRTGQFRGTLITRTAAIKENGSLIISPASEAGYKKLHLQRIKDFDQLRWQEKFSQNISVTARGSRWSPCIFVITVFKKKNSKVVWGGRYFFAPLKGCMKK